MHCRNKCATSALAALVFAGCAAAPPATIPPAGASPADTPYELYFLGGQSNMDGYGYTAELPAALRGDVERVRIFTGLTRFDGERYGGIGLWQPLTPGHGTGVRNDGQSVTLSARFGPELTFGRRLAALRPGRRIAIVKYSLGGSGLSPGVGYGNWDPNGELNQYHHALAAIRNARRQADIDGDGREDRLVPAGIVWMQGEADAHHSQAAADAYGARLERLMDLLRAELGGDELPVAVGLITDSGMAPDGSVMDYIGTVQQAQRAFADADRCATLVDVTVDLGYLDDAWHYDSAGMLRLGNAFAEAVHALAPDCGVP